MKRIDITGQKFGMLKVINYDSNSCWNCLCDCGNSHRARREDLKRGFVKSCGCHYHRMTDSPEWNSWRCMKSRCYKINDKEYKNYGARGIIVCDRWLNSFKNFFADMGPRPFGYTIDRIDNNGNYEPTNCRWATAKEQGNNSRVNRIITFNNISLNLIQWSERLNISTSIISKRLKAGWTMEQIIKHYKDKYE